MDDPTEDDGDDEYVEIPARMSRGDVLSTSDVPRDWYEHRERVYDVKEALVEEYLDRPEVYNVSITKGDRTSENGEIALLQVRVGLDDTSFAAEIPDRVGDVDVEKTEANHRHLR